mgnify:CR=1 FL=1
MSFTQNFFENKSLDNRKLWVERQIEYLIANTYLKENPDDYLVSNLLSKKDLEYDIQYLYGWERTPNGFEYRCNFQFDEESQNIVFDRNIIIKSNDGFVSDGSKNSDLFIREHAKELETLKNTYKIFDKLYLHYESTLNKEIESLKRHMQMGEFRIHDVAYSKNNHAHKFLQIYGELGQKLLIKWLNKLNDTEKSMDILLEEFANDIDKANKYFEYNLDEKYLRIFKFEYALLQELENFSTRGRYFKLAYKNKIKNENIQNRKKLN